MRRTPATVIAAWVLLYAKGASMHRIDEYLYATLLSLKTNRGQASYGSFRVYSSPPS
jgi:hypothetical protein